MRRLLASRWLLIALVVLVIGGSCAGEDDGGDDYFVRAIFDNASLAVAGRGREDRRAPVGASSTLDVTAGQKAAVTLSIDNAGFTPFKPTPAASSACSR